MKKLGKSLQERITEKSEMFHELMKLEDRKMLVGFTQLDLTVRSLPFASCLAHQATSTGLTSSTPA